MLIHQLKMPTSLADVLIWFSDAYIVITMHYRNISRYNQHKVLPFQRNKICLSFIDVPKSKAYAWSYWLYPNTKYKTLNAERHYITSIMAFGFIWYAIFRDQHISSISITINQISRSVESLLTHIKIKITRTHSTAWIWPMWQFFLEKEWFVWNGQIFLASIHSQRTIAASSCHVHVHIAGAFFIPGMQVHYIT